MATKKEARRARRWVWWCRGDVIQNDDRKRSFLYFQIRAPNTPYDIYTTKRATSPITHKGNKA